MYERFVPGAGPVRESKHGTGWYCVACQAYIRPIFIRKADAVHPACRECFYDDLVILQPDGGPDFPKEVADVDVPATAISA